MEENLEKLAWVEEFRTLIYDYEAKHNISLKYMYRFLGMLLLETCYSLKFDEETMTELFDKMKDTYEFMQQIERKDNG